MIDLRSDTVTLPTEDMLANIVNADLGDDGRTVNGRGSDPTVNELEDLAAKLFNTESALYFPTGTMTNHAGIMALCERGSNIALHATYHIYSSAKAMFEEDYFGMNPFFYELDANNYPCLDSLSQLLEEEDIDLICIENTYAAGGGIPIPPQHVKQIMDLAEKHDTKVFVDGARIFNASVSLETDVAQLINGASGVGFCLSKGLGAPVGSVLCGDAAYIQKARTIRKKLGGTMRQAGVIASPAIEVLAESNIKRLEDDHKNAAKLYEALLAFHDEKIALKAAPTNMVVFKPLLETLSLEELIEAIANAGVLVKLFSKDYIRATFHKDITNEQAEEAIQIISDVLEAHQ